MASTGEDIYTQFGHPPDILGRQQEIMEIEDIVLSIVTCREMMWSCLKRIKPPPPTIYLIPYQYGKKV